MADNNWKPANPFGDEEEFNQSQDRLYVPPDSQQRAPGHPYSSGLYGSDAESLNDPYQQQQSTGANYNNTNIPSTFSQMALPRPSQPGGTGLGISSPATLSEDLDTSTVMSGETFRNYKQTAYSTDQLNPNTSSDTYGKEQYDNEDQYGLEVPTLLGASANEAWAQRQNPTNLRRYGTKKVNLVHGEVFCNEYIVPTAIRMSVLPRYVDAEEGSTEFSHLRYTACTVDPDNFCPEKGYTLRGFNYNRQTELLIGITYYNEDKSLVTRTLHGVMQNIRDICNAHRSSFWNNGQDAWKRMTVVLVLDGIEPCDKNVLDVLATMGLYQDGILKKEVNGEETVTHIFEYTTQLCVTPNSKLIRPEEGDASSLPPVQFIVCLKQQNSKKINSHRWIFNALCPQLQPEIVCLLDAGTKPGSKSLYNLWEAFYRDPKVGGAAGEIHAMLGNKSRKLINPLVAAQNFEYKVSNILDKPLESSFGFISVLPGAFSAYRYAAVKGRPLEQYFHGDHTLAARLGPKGLNGMGIFRKNMFLAEDRILCHEVTFKKDENWHLTYVKAAKAETDVPSDIAELMGQRRRWLNGSFAASIYALLHFGRIYRSGHNWLRIAFLHLQFLYNIVQMILSWFMLGCFYLSVTIIIDLAAKPSKYGSPNNSSFPFGSPGSSIISLLVRYAYILMLIMSFALALGCKPKGSKKVYWGMVIGFGIIQYYALINSFYLIANAFAKSPKSISEFFSNFFSSTSCLIIVSLCSTLGLYVVSAIIYLDVWHIFTSFLQYTFLMPCFTNILNVYAFCNWHDVSWGTKGSDTVALLPAAQAITTAGGYAVVEEVDKPQADVDVEFQEVVYRALAPVQVDVERDTPSPDDQTKLFRTWLILTWIISNIVLVWIITSTSNEGAEVSENSRLRIAYFFAVLLWSSAFIAVFRLLGCIIFVSKSAVGRLIHRS